ncbi:MAG TPA: hypothetical protein VK914_10350 [bacterium]|jgi:hypothetical protein|nr:hypothetical protein [bacterium]
MDDPRGYPDFSAELTGSSVGMFAPYGAGSFSVLPSQVVLASNPDGSPKFELDLVEYLGDSSANGQYSVLDFSLAGSYPLDAALGLARSGSPGATVKAVTMDGGFGRLYATNSAVPLPADLLNPVPLGWWSSDLARWTTRLSAEAGVMVKDALQGQAGLLLGARLELTVTGVAPRLAATAQFEPPALMAALLAAYPSGLMPAAAVCSFFAQPASIPLSLRSASPLDPGSLAQVLADRLIAAYAKLAPAPGASDPAYVQFRTLGPGDAGQVSWDLSQAALVQRPWVFTLDPIGGLRALNNPAVLASVVKNVSIQAMTLGGYGLDLMASLPPSRVGFAAIGARVEAPAKPPARPSSISQTTLFIPPSDSGSQNLLLAATEPLAYTITCFGVIAAGDFVQEYDSAALPHSDTWVQLGADSFPFSFTVVTVGAQLAALATVQGALSYQVGPHAVQQAFSLPSGAAGELALAAPLAATGLSVAIQASPLDGSSPLSLPPQGAGRIDLDVHSFAGYGPHSVTVQSALPAGANALFIEFVPESQAAAGQATGKVALTPQQASATWGYASLSPFHSGYCFRVAAAPGAAAAPWSPPQAPDAVLTLNPDGTPLAPAPALTPLSAP